jgi:hypothetical protein
MPTIHVSAVAMTVERVGATPPGFGLTFQPERRHASVDGHRG